MKSPRKIQRLNKRYRRKGLTIIHMLAIIGLSVVILSLVSVLIRNSLDGNRELEFQSQFERRLLDFEVQFREDVHSSYSLENKLVSGSSIGPAKDANLLVLEQPDRSIHYSRSGEAIERIVVQNDVPVHREQFAFRSLLDVKWNIDNSSTSVTISGTKFRPRSFSVSLSKHLVPSGGE